MHHPSQFGHSSTQRNAVPDPPYQNLPRVRSYINTHYSLRKKDVWSHYIIGDVYERFEGLRKGTFGCERPSDGPYLRHLKKLSRQGWSNLLYLVDFMETSTLPTKKHLLTTQDFKERYSRTDVTIIDCHKASGLNVKRITSAQGLGEALDTMPWKDESGSIRLIITSDLSSTVIETLGSSYDVDPRVFREHLMDGQWYHIRDPWYNFPRFKSMIGRKSFFSAVYPRMFYFPDEASVRKAEEQAGSFNVQRSVLLDDMASWTEPEESRVGNLRSTTAFWSRPQEHGKGSLGILILDPDISDSKPLWGDSQSYREPPSMHSHIPERSGYESTIDNFVTSAQILVAEKGDCDIGLFDLVGIQMRTMAIHWRISMQYAETRLSIIEWALQPPNPETARSIEEAFDQLHPWRRRIPLYRNLLSRTIHVISLQAQTSPVWAALLTDFTDLESQRSLLEARVDRITSAMTAIIAIDENKKATGNANDVSRITYLAFVFVPLSFLTGIFSMDRGFPEGGTMIYWVFVLLAVPVAGIPLCIALNWEKISDWAQRARRGMLRGEDRL